MEQWTSGWSKKDETSKARFISKLGATSKPHCRTLLILDDVYKSSIYVQASNLGDHVYMIAISRDQNVNEENRVVQLNPVGDEFFIELFSPFEHLLSSEDLQKLVKACAGLPLIGQLVVGQLRKYNTRITANKICSKILRQRKIEINHPWHVRRHAKIYQMFLIDFDDHPEIQHRFLAFLLYPKRASVPLSELAILWQVPKEDAAEIAVELQSRSWARGNGENVETLSIHDYLYEEALDFAFDKLEPAKKNLLGVRRALLRKYGGAVLADAVKCGSYELVTNVVTVLISTSGQSQDIEKTLFDICSHPSALAAFFAYDVMRFPGTTHQSNFSVSFVCHILNRMLVCDKASAMKLIETEGILPKLKATIANGRKAMENALFASLIFPKLFDILVSNNADIRVIDDEGNTLIMNAASRNRNVTLEKLLTRCGDMLNMVNSNGDTAIHIACRFGNVNASMVLLKSNKLKLGLRNKANRTALELVAAEAREGMKDVSRKMRKLYPEVPSDSSKTERNSNWPPLATAVYRGNFDRVDELLGKGSDLSFRVDGLLGTVQRKQVTLLHLAALKGDVRIAKMLTDKGLRVDSRTEDNATALYVAAQNGHQPVVEFLEGKGADIDSRTDQQATPLYIAAQSGHHQIVVFLAGKGADTNARKDTGATPLFIAAQEGHLPIVEFLANKGADIDARTDNKASPLSIAAQEGHHQIVEFLASKSADINARVYKQETPLFIAAQNGRQQIVEFLESMGASTDARTDEQATPLYVAAYYGHRQIVEFLAGKGADIDVRTDQQATPLYIAAQNGYHRIVAFLAGKGADIDARKDTQATPLYIAAQNGHQQIVEFLVDEGADIDARTDDMATPLYIAAQEGHNHIVEFLASKGADINARMYKQETPLYVAAETGQQQIAEFLVAKGAVINALADDQTTPLHIAAHNGHQQIVEFLAAEGADINVRAHDQITPLYFAAQNGHAGIVEFLLRNGADPSARSAYGTSITTATSNGHEDNVSVIACNSSL